MSHLFCLLPGEQATISCGASPFLFRIDILIRPNDAIHIVRSDHGARLERHSEDLGCSTISVPDRSLVYIRCSSQERDFSIIDINPQECGN
ncbi:hypothetical protein [Laceyella putida]|uniref:Uncharacterized protein n=1 Tax=Laceyella putida TaxID=110101 RepID=A0ABW2RNZ6_9BACL